MAKTKKNPFKMWGSYVGASVGLLISNAEASTFNSFLCSFRKLPENAVCPSFLTTNLLLLVGVGFLIGWGIHSLFKKRRK